MLFDEDRMQEFEDEDKRDRAEEDSCPCCGGTLETNRFSENGYLVESIKSCGDCDYQSGYSYGHRILELPEGYVEDEFGDIVKEDAEENLE